MPSIESFGFPLVFKVTDGSAASSGEAPSGENTVAIKTEVRSLEGMQKEAVVSCEPGGAVWRLVSDEGPYLNGKDMAPFPLAFFTAGMQFSFLSQFLQGARAQDVPLEAVSLVQDNFYSMEGSFLRGDATGGAKPPELRLKVQSSAPASKIAELAYMAEASSPAHSLFRTLMQNTFSLNLNGRPLTVTDLAPSPPPGEEDPARHFESIAPGSGGFLPDIITRVRKAEKHVGVEGGAGSSFKAEQKRTIHVHGEARWLGDMLMETVVQLHKPIGSSFRFVCDETKSFGGKASAPPPLAYLSAGIGFCYMTQLGRYAIIKKQELDSYRIVQKNFFQFEGSANDGSRRAGIEPTDTKVFLDAHFADEGDAPKLVSMGQQTCFLHAAMRGEHASQISVELNGEDLPSS
jgi:uncharacterized OsmC-like protein